MVFDLETTNRNPMRAEILTGHFIMLDEKLSIIDELGIECRPELWNDEAEQAFEIHGISKYMSATFPNKQESFDKLMRWIMRFDEVYSVCHANRRVGGFKTYDYTVLSLALFDTDHYFDFTRTCRSLNIISTHSLAKYLKINCELNLKSLAQYLGVELDNHHNAKSDCVATYNIFKHLYPRVNLGQFLDKENYGGSKNDTIQTTKRSKTTKPKLKRDHSPDIRQEWY
jgi:DNA polymerase III epsilon subunit-like protein